MNSAERGVGLGTANGHFEVIAQILKFAWKRKMPVA